MAKYAIIQNGIEQLKQGGLCDERGIAFATEMSASKANPPDGVAPYQGNNWFANQGKLFDAIIAVNGDLLCILACKIGMLGASINPDQIKGAFKIGKQWVRNIYWGKSGNVLGIYLTTDELISVRVDNSTKAKGIEFATAFGFDLNS